ncbi:MAG: MinD/ParA family protein [Phycisphaerales bacterium]|nr:MAG: MinD/ParA family protein [Phycisphaerales bacterium]
MAHESLRGYGKDQATRLRALMRRKARRPVTLAVTSGKGGVGKTNVAVNLSICLAAEGMRVTLADVDLGLANADLLLNLQPRCTLSHVLGGVKTIEEVCVDGPGGLRFVPGASGRRDLANLTEFDLRGLMAQLRESNGNADIVVLDCGAGISRNVVAFAQVSDYVLVVTTPEPTALTDAYATIKVLHREGYAGRLSSFINIAESRVEAQTAYRRLAGVAKRFLDCTVADDGYMLHDSKVELAVQERCPFVIRYPESNASACIVALTGKVRDECVDRTDGGGLLKRVAGLFI